MKKILFTLLTLSICTSVFPQETQEARRARRGQAAGYGSRDATTLSMMGWGLGIAVGFATIAALLDNSSSSQAH